MESLHFSMQVELGLPPDWPGRLWRHVNAGQSVSPHRHAELEVNFVVRGQAIYLLDDRTYELGRNSVAWLFPRQDHVLLRQSPDFMMWILIVRPEWVVRLCREPSNSVLNATDPPGAFCRRVTEEAGGRLRALSGEVSGARPDTDFGQAGLGYALLAFWEAYSMAGPETAGPGSPVHPAVEKAARLIRAGEEPESLEQLARQLGLSETRLGMLFRRQTGMALVEFRNRQRLERFLRLRAREPGRSLAALALDAGFGSYAQFYRLFVRWMGCPPGQYGRQSPAHEPPADVP